MAVKLDDGRVGFINGQTRIRTQAAAASGQSSKAAGKRKSPKDFQRFLMIAKASCAELRSQCDVALEIKAIFQPDFDELIAQTGEIARIIAGLYSSISNSLD